MKRVLFLLLFILPLIFTACSPKPAETPVLKVAALPVLDSLPLFVAQEAGYFEQQGVKVEIVLVPSAPERDQLMQSKQVDGMLSELVTTLYYNRNEPQIKIVRFARTASSEAALFRILASANSGIKSTEDLRGVEIGISQGTVIEYVADRVLEKAGVSLNEVQKLAVPKIADRTALLQSGELKAAVMPDPLASLLIKKGAVLVADDTIVPELSSSIFAFRNETLKDHPAQVKAFMAAVELAVKDINSNPKGYNKLLADQKLVPAEIIESGFSVPPFPTASVPDQNQFADALRWVTEKKLVERELRYEDSIDPAFLPK